MTVYNQARIWIASFGVLLVLTVAIVNGQQAPPQARKGKEQAQPQQPRRPADPNESYVLQTYEVGDLIIDVQDHPYSEELLPRSSKGNGGGRNGRGGFGGGGGGYTGGGRGGGGGQFSVPIDVENQKQGRSESKGTFATIKLCQFGGGGATAEKSGDTSKSTGVSMDDLVRVLINTVASDSWALKGGEGKVEPLGTALVVYQTPTVHKSIEKLLDQIRSPAGNRRTLTVDARWLMLGSDDFDLLVTKDSTSLLEADRKTLASFTRRRSSMRGLINCFSGQLVYLTSGTARNIVSGWIPVVGAVGTGERAVSLAAADAKPQFRFVADTSPALPLRESKVGYQPIMASSNLGAVLEIRPTLIGGSKWVIAELKSTLTAPSEHGAEPIHNSPGGITPAVDRVAVETVELATTLRMPLGKPILVGGLTYLPGSAKARDDAEKAERQQLYLVLEIR